MSLEAIDAALDRLPAGPAEQVPHAVRTRLPGPLGDRPAVLARKVRQQPGYQVPQPATGLNPREPTRYPAHQDLERLLPAGRVYAVTQPLQDLQSLHTEDQRWPYPSIS